VPTPATDAGAGVRDPDGAPQEHEGIPRLSDPGKDDRAAHGVPVVPAFDGYRAFAIMAIVVFHVIHSSGMLAGGSLPAQLAWGTGPQLVDVLFIVSGFVVFLPTVAQGGRFGSVRGYAIRRGARLLPAFWLSLLVMLLVMATKPDVPLPGIGGLLSNFSGQQTIVSLFSPGTLIGFGPDSPVWTLTLEIGFYVVLPFIAAAYFRRPLIGLAIALAIVLVWREAFQHIEEVAGWVGIDLTATRSLQLWFSSLNQLPGWAFSFAAGMTGAWAYVELRRRYDRVWLERMATRVLVVSAIAFAVFVYLAGHRAVGSGALTQLPNLRVRESAFISLGYTASLATVMVSMTLVPRRLQMPFAYPLARKLGDISYGIYLIQAPLIFFLVFHSVISTDGSVGSTALWLAIVIPVAMLYGYLSARLVEQPIRRWAHRFGRKAQVAPGEGSDRAVRAGEAPAG
jgi:peptidoglycan/LPS O-acetylase OafA/YrhL